MIIKYQALGILHVEDRIPLLQELTSEWERGTGKAASHPVGQSDRGDPGAVSSEHLEPTTTWLPNLPHCQVVPWSETQGIQNRC